MTFTQRCYAVGCMLFLWYAAWVMVPMFALLAGFSLALWQTAVSLVLFLGISWFFHRNYFGSRSRIDTWIHVLATLSLFGLCILFTAAVYDTSFDGNWYHMDAIYLLKEGWKPAYTLLADSETTYCSKYLNHFPLGTWVYGAQCYLLTNNIESGKAIDLQLMLSCLLVGQHLGRSVFRFSVLVSWILAFLLAASPIQVLNIFNYYADGPAASLTFLGCMFAIYQIEEGGWLKGFLALLAFALLVNLKFNTAATAVVMSAAFFGFLLYTRAYTVKKLVLIGLGWGVFSFGILGWSPYMSNLLRFGHPLYPMSEGTKRVFDPETNYPANFIGMNRFEKFVRSFYGKPEWCRNPCVTHPKTLFTKLIPDAWGGGNTDLAGFGPFAPEVFLALLPLGLYAVFRLHKKYRMNALFLIGVIFVSIFINPEAWVLRYVPQFWLFFVMLLVIMFKESQLTGPAFVLAFALIQNNVFLYDFYSISNYERTRRIKEEAMLVKNNSDTLEYYAGWTRTYRNRLYSLGLDPKEDRLIEQTDSTAIPFTSGMGACYRKRIEN